MSRDCAAAEEGAYEEHTRSEATAPTSPTAKLILSRIMQWNASTGP